MRDLKIVNPNAENLWEVYGISKEEFDALVEKYKNKEISFKEAILEQDTIALFILFSSMLDKNECLVNGFVHFLELMEEVEINSFIDLIEVLKSVDRTNYLIYIATFFETFNDLEG